MMQAYKFAQSCWTNVSNPIWKIHRRLERNKNNGIHIQPFNMILFYRDNREKGGIERDIAQLMRSADNFDIKYLKYLNELRESNKKAYNMKYESDNARMLYTHQ